MKKFKINNSNRSPENSNFSIVGLHKEPNISSDGFLNDIKYWKEYDGTTYSDLYVHEHRRYSVDPSGLVITRTMVIDWYLTDDTIGYTKTFPLKYYSKQQAIAEGITRRGNIADMAKIYCIDNLGLPYSFDLLNSVKQPLELFIQGYTQPLRDAISSSTKPYLTQELKNGIVSILTYTNVL